MFDLDLNSLTCTMYIYYTISIQLGPQAENHYTTGVFAINVNNVNNSAARKEYIWGENKFSISYKMNIRNHNVRPPLIYTAECDIKFPNLVKFLIMQCI